MKALRITVSHEDLPGPLTLVIDHGNGFDDNAARVGWEPTIGPPAADLAAAERAIAAAAPGSTERLAAQVALQRLQQTRQPNPVSSLVYLIRHVREFIEQLLIDQAAVDQVAEQARGSAIQSALAARVTIE